MRYLRNQQLARMKQIQAERPGRSRSQMRIVKRLRASRQRPRQHGSTPYRSWAHRQREHMQKEIMRLLHQQVHPRPVSMRYLDLFSRLRLVLISGAPIILQHSPAPHLPASFAWTRTLFFAPLLTFSITCNCRSRQTRRSASIGSSRGCVMT